jgi:hypothetical protein
MLTLAHAQKKALSVPNEFLASIATHPKKVEQATATRQDGNQRDRFQSRHNEVTPNSRATAHASHRADIKPSN